MHFPASLVAACSALLATTATSSSTGGASVSVTGSGAMRREESSEQDRVDSSERALLIRRHEDRVEAAMIAQTAAKCSSHTKAACTSAKAIFSGIDNPRTVCKWDSTGTGKCVINDHCKEKGATKAACAAGAHANLCTLTSDGCRITCNKLGGKSSKNAADQAGYCGELSHCVYSETSPYCHTKCASTSGATYEATCKANARCSWLSDSSICKKKGTSSLLEGAKEFYQGNVSSGRPSPEDRFANSTVRASPSSIDLDAATPAQLDSHLSVGDSADARQHQDHFWNSTVHMSHSVLDEDISSEPALLDSHLDTGDSAEAKRHQDFEAAIDALTKTSNSLMKESSAEDNTLVDDAVDNDSGAELLKSSDPMLPPQNVNAAESNDDLLAATVDAAGSDDDTLLAQNP